MNDREGLRIIAGWLNNLAELTRHGEEGRPTKDKLAVYATILGKDFPSAAFTSDSLHAAAHGAEWFPAYDVVRQRVGEWWRDHRPSSTLTLPGPYADAPVSELSESDRSWLNYYDKRAQEQFGPPREGGTPSSRRRCLSLIKAQSPGGLLPVWWTPD